MGTQPPGMPSSRGFCCSPFCYLAQNLNDLANDVAAGGRRRTSQQILNGSRISALASSLSLFTKIEFIWHASDFAGGRGVDA